ncbi:hypothetical protein BDV18DRAFT_134217 [Aspergillus unguis]
MDAPPCFGGSGQMHSSQNPRFNSVIGLVFVFVLAQTHVSKIRFLLSANWPTASGHHIMTILRLACCLIDIKAVRSWSGSARSGYLLSRSILRLQLFAIKASKKTGNAITVRYLNAYSYSLSTE